MIINKKFDLGVLSIISCNLDMKKFHSLPFDLNGINIPEFELNSGNLIRIYIPNFHQSDRTLGMDFSLELANHFQKKWPEMKWVKNYSQNKIQALIQPITVERYLRRIVKIDSLSADRIVEKLNVSLKNKFESLGFKTRKALSILAAFCNHKTILFDYYGIDAKSMEFLEAVINSEIGSDKSAIALDNLQYATKKEPFENIIPIKIA